MSDPGVPRQAEREAREAAERAYGRSGSVLFPFEAGWGARDPEVRALTEALAGLTEAAGEAVELLQRTAVGENTSSTLTGITLGLKHPLMLARSALPVPAEGEGAER